MELSAVQSEVEKHLASRVAEFGLEAGRVRAVYVLNAGGFVNQSFRITDGRKSLHIKLSDDPESLAGLRRWQELHHLLEQRYHAPPLLGWVNNIPDTGLEGPLFVWIDGAVPERLTPALAEAVLPVVERLHRDHELARCLRDDGPPLPCSRVYLDSYHDRFTEDLKIIAADRPPFVTATLLEWMGVEADRLARMVDRSAVFQEPAVSPIHGDLWVNNLLVTPTGEVYLLDWDGLCVGDPALDLAMLFGPSAADLRPLRWQELPAWITASEAVRERLNVYARASLLDWVIDVLADYVEADAAPEHADRVREEKEEVHRRALFHYRELYGAPPI